MKACVFDGCGLDSRGLGLCGGHYSQQYRGEELRPLRYRNEGKGCRFDDCHRAAKTRGYCPAHYHQHRTGLELRPIGPRVWDAERVIAEAFAAGECLLFGTTQATRYPQVRYRGGNILAHRLVYAEVHGEIPPGVPIHHKCGNSRCVNPDHLQPASAAENTLEMLGRKAYEAQIAALEAKVKTLEHELAEARQAVIAA